MNKNVLSIAGSDPSGGAGIQADLKTFTSLGVYGCAALTSLTVQNTSGVKEIINLDPAFIRSQIEAVLEDIDISFIKTGMLGNSRGAMAAGESVRGYFLICDPVLFSKSGLSLFDNDSMDVFENYIASESSIMTPNYDELLILSRHEEDDPVRAGEKVMKKFDRLKAIVIKGGHINAGGPISSDILLVRDGQSIKRYDFVHPRVMTENTHGTGCTFSSALTAFLARGGDIINSVRKASDYVNKLIRFAAKYKIGKGNGPLPHFLLCPDRRKI